MDIGKIFQNATTLAQTWGGYMIIFLGAILVIWAVVLLVKGLMTHGNGRGTNWLMIILMILIGGFLMAQGFSGVKKFADIGTSTLEQLAQ